MVSKTQSLLKTKKQKKQIIQWKHLITPLFKSKHRMKHLFENRAAHSAEWQDHSTIVRSSYQSKRRESKSPSTSGLETSSSQHARCHTRLRQAKFGRRQEAVAPTDEYRNLFSCPVTPRSASIPRADSPNTLQRCASTHSLFLLILIHPAAPMQTAQRRQHLHWTKWGGRWKNRCPPSGAKISSKYS